MATPFDSPLLPISAVDTLMDSIQGALLADPWVQEQFGSRVGVSQVPIQDPMDLEMAGSAIIIAEAQWLPEGWSAGSTYPASVLLISAQWPAELSGYVSFQRDTRTSARWLLHLFKILSTNPDILAARGGVPPRMSDFATSRRPVQTGGIIIATTARIQTGTPRTILGVTG